MLKSNSAEAHFVHVVHLSNANLMLTIVPCLCNFSIPVRFTACCCGHPTIPGILVDFQRRNHPIHHELPQTPNHRPTQNPFSTTSNSESHVLVRSMPMNVKRNDSHPDDHPDVEENVNKPKPNRPADESCACRPPNIAEADEPRGTK